MYMYGARRVASRWDSFRLLIRLAPAACVVRLFYNNISASVPGFFRHCPRHSGRNAIAKSYTFTVLRNTSRPRNRLNAQPPRTVEDGGEDDEVEDGGVGRAESRAVKRCKYSL